MNHQSKRITREELYRLIWSKPAVQLAADLGISDVAIGKICKKLCVPKPAPGHWQRIAHGHPVSIPPLPVVATDQVTEIEIWPVRGRLLGPPDEATLDRVTSESLAENRIAVADSLKRAHPLVRYTKRLFENGEVDPYGRLMVRWGEKLDGPYLDLRVSKGSLHRSLLILDALLKSIELRGYKLDLSESVSVIVGQEAVRFYVWEKVDRSEREPTAKEKADSWRFERWQYSPSGNLTFTIDEIWAERKNWKDKAHKPLEDQLNDIVTGFVMAAHAIRHTRLEQEHEERRRKELQLRRQHKEQQRESEMARRETLEHQAESWRRSKSLHSFLTECERLFSQSVQINSNCAEARWLAWARSYADELDPLQSGCVQELVARFNANSGL